MMTMVRRPTTTEQSNSKRLSLPRLFAGLVVLGSWSVAGLYVALLTVFENKRRNDDDLPLLQHQRHHVVPTINSSTTERSHTAARTSLPSIKREIDKKAIDSHNNNEEAKNVVTADQKGKFVRSLDCSRFPGGPFDPKATEEMVYWRHIPSDASYYTSPYFDDNKFVTFELDGGGFNNIRMGLETVLALALAMGRTLVLPPAKRVAGMQGTTRSLLEKNAATRRHEDGGVLDIQDFFDLTRMRKQYPGLSIITMQEFLERQVIQRNLLIRDNHTKLFPPNHRTDWNGNPKRLWSWLRARVKTVIWNTEECIAVFPASAADSYLSLVQRLNQTIQHELQDPETASKYWWKTYLDKPIPVNSSLLKRLREIWAERKQFCLYDDLQRQEPVLRFPFSREMQGGRMLVHFYAFVVHERWQDDLWLKRFVRDAIRYKDEIQCAAARIVQALRGRQGRQFDSLHVRRGDFFDHYPTSKVTAQQIFNRTRQLFDANTTLYIATDEPNRSSFFELFQQHYRVVYLHDFQPLLPQVNPNYVGMIDQLVASKARHFAGCYVSTFTGYINRLRGYHANLRQAPGYELGHISSWYYSFEENYRDMQTYSPVKQQIWLREFPTSWRLIDTGILS